MAPPAWVKPKIARRLAKLARAPFIKVEATKFTEVGYVGRDVESIIRDLMEAAIKMVREYAKKKLATAPQTPLEDRVLDALLPPPRGQEDKPREDSSTRQTFRKSYVKASWTIKRSISKSRPKARASTS